MSYGTVSTTRVRSDPPANDPLLVEFDTNAATHYQFAHFINIVVGMEIPSGLVAFNRQMSTS